MLNVSFTDAVDFSEYDKVEKIEPENTYEIQITNGRNSTEKLRVPKRLKQGM